MLTPTIMNKGILKNTSTSLESESKIKSELLEDENSNKSMPFVKSKKTKHLSNNNGLAGPYSEIACTLGSLAGISYIAYPHNVLLYFGITYPSMPFILRFLHTLNDKGDKTQIGMKIKKERITYGK